MTDVLKDLKELLSTISTRRISVQLSSDEWFEAVTELQENLLQTTIKYVYHNVPWYRKLLSKLHIVPENIKTKRDLSKLPFTTKKDLLRNWSDFISRTAKIIGLKTTSGTIARTFICVSQEELDALKMVYDIRSKLHPSEPVQDEYAPILLRVITPHRIIYPMARVESPLTLVVTYNPWDVNIPWSYRTTTAENIASLLSEEFNIAGRKYKVTYLSIYPELIKQLTYHLYQFGIDPKELKLKGIYTTGSYVTESLRRFVSEHWGAEIFSSYSLTEINTIAIECAFHTLHHFDIFAIPEVVDPRTGKPVSPGEEGILVLTSLYPFQQAQPLIRYWTDDVVVLTEEICKCGFKGISIKRFVGRYKYCIDLRDILPASFKKKFFSHIDVYEILDSFSELAAMNPPRFLIKKLKKEDTVKILIEAELLHKISERRKKDLEKEIKEKIEYRYSEWEPYFSSGKITLLVKLSERDKPRPYFWRV